MSGLLDSWIDKLNAFWPAVVSFAPILIIGGLVAVFAFVAFGILRTRLVRVLRGSGTGALTWREVVADVVARTARLTIAVLSVAVALAVTGHWSAAIGIVLTVVLLMQVGLWLAALLRGLLDIYALRRTHDQSTLRNALSIIRILSNVAVWSIILMAILSNLGVNITALVAGLGVGGVAIGLAAQSIFADLFSSLSIVFDRPFVTGDFITWGEFSGTIENIGMKSTRVRALSGEQIVLANHNLVQSTIRNYKSVRERRVVFRLGLVYETDVEKAEKVPALIRSIVEATEGTRFDRCHFVAFGDSALLFETVYYVLDPDYNHYMNINQSINFAIMRKFAQEGLDFAYPTQMVYLAGTPGAALGVASSG